MSLWKFRWKENELSQNNNMVLIIDIIQIVRFVKIDDISSFTESHTGLTLKPTIILYSKTDAFVILLEMISFHHSNKMAFSDLSNA